MDQEKIGKVIRDIRKKNHLSQSDFAEKYNVSFQAVSKWENGKNIPDIQTLKQICEDYELDLNSFLNAEKVHKNKKIYIFLSIIILLIISIGIVLYNHTFDFEFKTLTTTCSDFKVSGSIAYNKKNSSIYISHIDYCGGDTQDKYLDIECSLNENNNNKISQIDKCNYTGKAITLEKFLEDIKFNVDKYEQTCHKYSDNKLSLEIKAKTEDGEEKNFSIPLKLEDNCK